MFFSIPKDRYIDYRIISRLGCGLILENLTCRATATARNNGWSKINGVIIAPVVIGSSPGNNFIIVGGVGGKGCHSNMVDVIGLCTATVIVIKHPLGMFGRVCTISYRTYLLRIGCPGNTKLAVPHIGNPHILWGAGKGGHIPQDKSQTHPDCGIKNFLFPFRLNCFHSPHPFS